MRRKLVFITVILLIIASIVFIDYKSKNIGVGKLDAYAPGYGYGPTLVNSFSPGGFLPPVPPGPPVSVYNDVLAWQKYSPFGVPTPVAIVIAGTYAPDGLLPSVPPGGTILQNYMRIAWSGTGQQSLQYATLPSSMFENVGSGSVTTAAGDWTNYDYIRLHFYRNNNANSSCPSDVSQTVAISDGSMTITPWAVDVPGQVNIEFPPGTGTGIGPDILVDRHVSVSLRYLANQYNPATGRYFSVSNVAAYTINAVKTDFTATWPIASTSDGFPSDYKSVIMYYSTLTLVARLPYYEPATITALNILYNGAIPNGINVSWNPITYTVTNLPVTAYHIYRATSNLGPWLHNGFAAAGVTVYADTSITIGNMPYYYKVLTCDNGPTSAVNEKLNTVNATYDEALLGNAILMATFMPQIPTMTATATITPTYDPFMTTPTITPTATVTPVPTSEGLTQAHVFPNPFNPNTPAPYNKFKVQNVPLKTKVQIYSMDGALVIDGEVKSDVGFVWDGKNKNGSKVVSGLYYLVMKDPKNKVRTERVIVCYKCDTISTEPGE